MGRVQGSGEGAGNRRGERGENGVFFFSPPPPSFRPRTCSKGYYIYPPQSSTVKIKDGGYNNTNTKKVSPTKNTPALQDTRYKE